MILQNYVSLRFIFSSHEHYEMLRWTQNVKDFQHSSKIHAYKHTKNNDIGLSRITPPISSIYLIFVFKNILTKFSEIQNVQI